jgi:hypothetical protein
MMQKPSSGRILSSSIPIVPVQPIDSPRSGWEKHLEQHSGQLEQSLSKHQLSIEDKLTFISKELYNKLEEQAHAIRSLTQNSVNKSWNEKNKETEITKLKEESAKLIQETNDMKEELIKLKRQLEDQDKRTNKDITTAENNVPKMTGTLMIEKKEQKNNVEFS